MVVAFAGWFHPGMSKVASAPPTYFLSVSRCFWDCALVLAYDIRYLRTIYAAVAEPAPGVIA